MKTLSHNYLEGQLLVATPIVTGSSFRHAVIFICAHGIEGAMGVIINHTLDNICYDDLFEQLKLPTEQVKADIPVHYGGPVEINRGFVIYRHEGKFLEDAMLTVGEIAISGSLNLLRAIAEGQGPKKRILALGYAGWSPGQLEQEIEENSWISVPLNSELVFDPDNHRKWERAGMLEGVDLSKLSTTAGHA